MQGLSPRFRSVHVTAGILNSGLTPLFIRSMRTGPRHWRVRGHREITWSFTKIFFKCPKCFVSRLIQFFFLVLWISNGYLWWHLWVDSASCIIKRFVVVFIDTDIMCRIRRYSAIFHLRDIRRNVGVHLRGTNMAAGCRMSLSFVMKTGNGTHKH